jgi:H+/gluconate symporter-like permease
MSLVAFVVCLLAGLQAQNTFSTILSNALVALAVTFVVGLVVGAMAQKMLDENLAAGAAEKIPVNPQAKTTGPDR